jgi:hypothetical protein
MPISRPLLIALVAAVVAVVGFYATQGSRNAADEPAPVASTPAPTPEPAATKPDEPAEPAAQRARTEAVSVTERAERSRAKREASAGIPRPVQRALDDRKLVVLFFFKPGSADDQATARGVAALRSAQVAVFTDPVDRLAKYRKLIGRLGISQAPAVVIVRKDRTARVVQGYIDPATLAQDVADAR